MKPFPSTLARPKRPVKMIQTYVQKAANVLFYKLNWFLYYVSS